MRASKVLALSLAAAVLVTASAGAQTTAAAPAAPVIAGWQDGFFIQSSDGHNRLLVGFIGQMDGRFSVDDPLPITNTFTIRKARPTFTGRVARYFDFKFMPDFGNGTTAILDAYFDVRFSPKFRIRSGKDKTPGGYELLIGDGASSSTDVDTNNGKDLAGRIVVQPFRSTQTPAGALNGLGSQIGGSTGKQAGPLPAFRTSVGQTYFSYATGATADGARARITPSIFYYSNALGLFSEYVRSTQNVSRAGSVRKFTTTAWNVTGSFLLTGEAASTGITRPRRPFDPPVGNFGALQVVARFAVLDLDDAIFGAGCAAAGASERARQFTVGVNWYPASVFKYYLNYERTGFDAGALPARPPKTSSCSACSSPFDFEESDHGYSNIHPRIDRVGGTHLRVRRNSV